MPPPSLQQTSTRRPRAATRCQLCRPLSTPTYILPPPVAVSLLAVVSVSVTVALHTLLTPSTTTSPLQPLLRLGRKLRTRLTKLLPRPPQIATPPQSPPAQDITTRIDDVRDRAIARLDSERVAFADNLSDDEYAKLEPLQQRELLAAAFSAPREAPVRKSGEAVRVAGVGSRKREADEAKSLKEAKKDLTFWKIAENVNGRAAALGFVLCLAREVAEPGHPSLFEQVVDVVVPIAQKTPPFLVAVCDAVVDLLT